MWLSNVLICTPVMSVHAPYKAVDGFSEDLFSGSTLKKNEIGW